MSIEGNFDGKPQKINPNEHHFRIVGKEREEALARLMEAGMTREQAEIQLLSKEVIADHNFIEDEKNKGH
ncbi:hypothetical protein K2P96_00780 [Patescibacteria group bacterium]|nr:hypothetical protein [Patescibacteria group bacterium]